MTFTIATVTNRWGLESYHCPYEWQLSIKRHGIEPEIIGLGEEWKGLMTKPRRLKAWLEAGNCETDCLIFTDSWDLVFATNPQEIVNLWEANGCPYIMNAERNCFPRHDWASNFAKGESTFRYPNSGFIVATPEDHLAVLNAMKLEDIPNDDEDPANKNPNDQEFFQRVFLEQPVRMMVDDMTRYCQTMHGVKEETFDFSKPMIKNVETNSFPMAFHFNGSKDENLMRKILKHLKLR